MAKSRNNQLKKHWLWWYLWRIKYLNADKIEQRIIAIATLKSKSINVNFQDELGLKTGFVFTGTIRDASDNVFLIEFTKIQVFGIKCWRYILMKIIWQRMPVLVHQIYIDKQPLIGKWGKLNFPVTFER